MTTTTTAPEAEAVAVKHKPWCSRAAVDIYRGEHGDMVHRCRTCDAFAIENLTPAEVSTSRYRCGAHLEHPVTWRGKGCTRCAAERRVTRRRKAPKPETTERNPE